MVEPILSESPKDNPFHWGSKPTAQKKQQSTTKLHPRNLTTWYIWYPKLLFLKPESSPFLGYPAVSFLGCTAYTIFSLLSHSRRCLISSGQISSRPPPFSGKSSVSPCHAKTVRLASAWNVRHPDSALTNSVAVEEPLCDGRAGCVLTSTRSSTRSLYWPDACHQIGRLSREEFASKLIC